MLGMLESLPWPFTALLVFVFIFVLTALVGSGADAALSKDFPYALRCQKLPLAFLLLTEFSARMCCHTHRWQFRLAAACRTPMLMFIVVPLSALQRLYINIRRRLRLMIVGTGGVAAAARHEQNVASIIAQLDAWNTAGRTRKLRTARPNFAAMSTKLGSNKGEAWKINTGHMKDILDVDVEHMTLTAEPGVTMGELTDVLLPLGLALQTHVEMESITLGGIAMGFGIETNSHRYTPHTQAGHDASAPAPGLTTSLRSLRSYGLFQESMLEYEFIDSHAKRHVVRPHPASLDPIHATGSGVASCSPHAPLMLPSPPPPLTTSSHLLSPPLTTSSHHLLSPPPPLTSSHLFLLSPSPPLTVSHCHSRRRLPHSQVSAATDPALFYAMPWSYGTLGFITRLKVKLVATKPFIRMVYEPTRALPSPLTSRAPCPSQHPLAPRGMPTSPYHPLAPRGRYTRGAHRTHGRARGTAGRRIARLSRGHSVRRQPRCHPGRMVHRP